MSPPPSPSRILVMLSGGGRTALNLLDAIDTRTLNARIVHAIASKPCAGAERLESRGVSVQILPGEIPGDTLASICRNHNAGLIALCGYLRYIHVPAQLTGRILNIHPSLLPKFGGKGFYGHRVHEAVIAAREPISGCTVHEVDNEFDHGQIILQKSCPVLPNDTPETLAARVFDLECIAYPEALQLVMNRLVPNTGTIAHDPTSR
ncbi:MAG: phosphoribosylglycinamide formyltransferase [Phycisphaeraceae bacterium]|nr:phosphoribosylglycinamide formyltransferase [Phycisphaeraceae bacterium]MBX3365959.1 phosphoribosylglycinamide formyltransferase [Phycisphaeraceae bacterium]